jgi:DNA-binding transcriptional ArsR family regulator
MLWQTGIMKTLLPVLVEPGPICCTPLGEQPRLSAAEANEVALRLGALADPARVAIVSILAGRRDHELTTRELAPLVSLTEATVSHHLKRLAEASLVTKHREGARVLYALSVPAVRAIAAVLDVCCDCRDSDPRGNCPKP